MRNPTIRRTQMVLVIILLALLILWLKPFGVIYGNNFFVNSLADAPDASPGDGICATALGDCTLRAAIEETNSIAGMDSISVPAGTYLLDSQLEIEDSVFLTGAGADVTILDGQDTTEVLRIKTVETLVCDSGKDNVASYDRVLDYETKS